MSNIRTQFKGGSMTDEQKVFQEQKNENDFKTDVYQRFQKLEYLCKSLEADMDHLAALHQEQQVESVHAIHDFSDNMLDSIKGFRKTLDEIQKENKQISDNNISILKYVESNYVTRKEYTKDYIDDVDNTVRTKHELASIRNEMIALLAKQKHEFDSKFAELLQKDTSKPDPIPDLKKYFEEKLELVTLNGQNSVLRSTNNEKHLHLIDKKLENIYQLIKQLQLQD